MNIYEYAMKLEKDGESFYRELAEKIEDKGIKSIFIMLAEEEIKHYIIFEKMNKQQSFTTQHSTHLIKHTLALFRKMREENPHFSFSRSYIESFRSALRTEENSYKFYMEKGNMLEDGKQKEAFLRIAEEEREHMILLQNLLTFAMDPVTWIENHELKMPL